MSYRIERNFIDYKYGIYENENPIALFKKKDINIVLEYAVEVLGVSVGEIQH